MLIVQEVKSAKQRRQFLNFPLKLYAKCRYYAPLFYGDEKKLLQDKTNIYSDYSDSKFFLCYNEKGKVLGRIGAIINYAHIKKTGVQNVRFTRLDAVDDEKVFAALLGKVEQYAAEHGINRVQGPLGYNDLDKEGLLIKGFDREQTYGGVYNYPYYQTHLENLGYLKEVDWIERMIEVPQTVGERYTKVADMISKKYGYTEVITNKMRPSAMLDKYADKIFALVDECYKDLHGTVPFTESAKKMLVEGLKIIIKPPYVSLVTDKDGNAVAFGLILPAIWHALHKSRGKLFPFGVFHFLPLLFGKPKQLEMALIAVKPELKNSGVIAMVVSRLWSNVSKAGITELESNANLENNYEINNFLSKFEKEQHKRRRCYYKEI